MSECVRGGGCVEKMNCVRSFVLASLFSISVSLTVFSR